MRKPAMIVFAVLFLLVLAGVGFYVWENVTKKPEVTIKAITYEMTDKITLLGVDIPTNVSFHVEGTVYNPNMISFKVTGGRYTVYANDISVGEGGIEEPFEVPARGSRDFKTDVKMQSASGLRAIVDALMKGSLKTRVQGSIQVELPIVGAVTIPIKEETAIG